MVARICGAKTHALSFTKRGSGTPHFVVLGLVSSCVLSCLLPVVFCLRASKILLLQCTVRGEPMRIKPHQTANKAQLALRVRLGVPIPELDVSCCGITGMWRMWGDA